MKKTRIGEVTKYVLARLGDWTIEAYRGPGWLLRYGRVRQCWPYRYYHACIGPVQVLLRYAPECCICLNDERILYPGKYCAQCRDAVERRRGVLTFGEQPSKDGGANA